jgi:hypothetical protein
MVHQSALEQMMFTSILRHGGTDWERQLVELRKVTFFASRSHEKKMDGPVYESSEGKYHHGLGRLRRRRHDPHSPANADSRGIRLARPRVPRAPPPRNTVSGVSRQYSVVRQKSCGNFRSRPSPPGMNAYGGAPAHQTMAAGQPDGVGG